MPEREYAITIMPADRIDPEFFRRPRTKKRRIILKWMGQDRNWRYNWRFRIKQKAGAQ